VRKRRAPQPAPAAPARTDRLWVQVLAALWIAGIVIYYLRLQLLRFLQAMLR
jgi:hypothetical protein